MSEATSGTQLTPAPDIASLIRATDFPTALLPRNDVEILKRHTAVVPREGGGSSTPRLIGLIIDVSGILDRPPSRTMTVEYDFAISRHDAPEVCGEFRLPSLKSEGAGKTGCLLHPRSRVRFAQTKTAHEHTGQREHSGLPCAMALRLTSCSSRRTALLPPLSRELPADVMPAPRHQNHTTSPYASGAYVYRALCVHRISPRVRDDGQRPSSAVRRAELCR